MSQIQVDQESRKTHSYIYIIYAHRLCHLSIQEVILILKLKNMSTSTLDSYNLLWLEWSIGSVLVGISGLLVLNYSDALPNFIHRTVKYGKSADSHSKLQFLELPKRYFFHFYSVALMLYIFLFALATSIYFNVDIFGTSYQASPEFLRKILDQFAKYDRFTNYQYVPGSPSRLAMTYQRAASGKSTTLPSTTRSNLN